MAEQAGDLIKDALGKITVYGAEATIEAVDAQLGIRVMNRMMAAFDADGIDLGYTEVSNLADEITVADGAIESMVDNLAFKLWSYFSEGQPMPQELAFSADSGQDTMRQIGVSIAQMEYPDTLPIGSGNECDSGFSTNHFYPDLQPTILAETNGSISLEDETNE